MNYSVDWAEQMRRLRFKNLTGLVDQVERDGVHFELPDCGIVLGRDYSGTVTGKELRPPYPVTVVEYPARFGPQSAAYPVTSSRRIVIAIEHEGYGEGGVLLAPSYYIDAQKKWGIPFVGWEFAFDDQEYLITRKPIASDLLVQPRILLPEQFKAFQRERGMTEAACLEATLRDASDELVSYWDMCKALSLRAVTTETVEPDPKKQSVRKILSKPPLHSYRVLTLTPGADLYPRYGGETGRTHASPRAHMRRGHMRTMKKTGKQVWVNSCMINGEGMIVKDYRVEAMK